MLVDGSKFGETAPPQRFLHWLLMHPEQMHVLDSETYGASTPNAQNRRGKLFSLNSADRAEAMAEGHGQLAKHGVARSRHAWWAFEGFPNRRFGKRRRRSPSLSLSDHLSDRVMHSVRRLNLDG
jgi:hypothetical protein